ncbi:hypothetical protein A3K01_03630 [candidate division WWE3 bacterium RIFOXYD1_FULL_43_17]|uniref:Cytochrome b5 heme-binding domain-containing protein n=3 Tax=Katanobacteria TaxID=422282 RepID=A0A1F4XCP7_UNCKA|nr:MAG: hypothetical protein UU59_C0020G0010 [candidate division WWE3 bacterium GW2011_GWE1_41_27]KKS59984.1 MAG: hypothetical protein UV26_C0011G0029 [candidate division WWE3 bacterium GW2011_GWF2_42_42]OGC79331.1 MAG: hypothetical protein A3K01_03630 [candidate division WWE3 bacterium RIFOXYD1_FULL_43_17]
MISKILTKVILVNLLVVAAMLGVIIVRGSKDDAGTGEVTTLLADIEVLKNDISQLEEIYSSTSSPVEPQTPVVEEKPVVVTAPVPVKAAPPPVDNRCLITVKGSQYDVTAYRKRHPGGDIFKCGSDMTSAFNDQHSSGTLKKMQQYLVN